MAIYRAVQMTFWTDTKINEDYSPEEKLLYLYLLTNPHSNLCGCYEVSISQMANEIGYKKETIKKLLDRMQRNHQSVIYAEDTREVLLLNWHKYNWTSSEKFQKALARDIDSVKNPEFKEYLRKISVGDYTVSIPYQYGMDTTDTVYVYDTDTVKDNKHKYGEYKNVLLTDKELEKLKQEYPVDWEKMIENLSYYMQSKSKSYSDHLATMRNWARREKKESKTENKGFAKGMEQRTYDWDVLERQLLAAQGG